MVGNHDDSPETDPGFQMARMKLLKYRQSYYSKGALIDADGFTSTSS
jgi:hypothetical protein